ncbi:MAG: VanZ family protein [Ethanoligenens sp.]|uniref:VanZ family protein n=1 Tax=Ethanoligenens sp. TaxID=2099655 RepID=UPI0039E73D24
MRTNQTGTGSQKAFVFLLFMLYMAALLKILLLRNAVMLSGSGAHAVNLIPLHTIFYYIGVALSGGAAGMRQAFANLAGNVILFLPFGYFIPMLIKPLRRGTRITLVTVGFSLMIEVLQYVLHVGSSDVDDVILNTLGGLAGFALLQLISNRRPLTWGGYAKILYLSAFLLCSGYVFAATQYSAQLGISPIALSTPSSAVAFIRTAGVQGDPAVETGEAVAARGDRPLDDLHAEIFHETQADAT